MNTTSNQFDIIGRLKHTEYCICNECYPVEEAIFVPSRKSKSTMISFRISSDTIVKLKEMALQLKMPYQTLMKTFIHQGIARPLTFPLDKQWKE